MIKTAAIKETEYKLSPSSVTLSKPGTYAFKAEVKGSTQHSLTAGCIDTDPSTLGRTFG